MDDEEGFDGFSSVHGIVCFLDLIEGESLGEDFSWMDGAVQDGRENDVSYIGRDWCDAASKSYVLPEEDGGIDVFSVRYAYASYDGSRAAYFGCCIKRELCAYAFKGSVGAGSVGHRHDFGDSFIASFCDDVCCTEFKGEFLAVYVAAHGNDALGSAHSGGNDAAEADSAVTHDDDGIPFLHFSRSGGMVAGRHDIGQCQEGIEVGIGVVRSFARYFDQGPARILEADIFCLIPCIHFLRRIEAVAVKAGLARSAPAVAVCEWSDDEIAFLDRRDSASDFFDDADGFMTREASMRTRIDAAEPPEVRTSDACTQHADHGFILAFYLRDRHFIIDLDTSWFYKYSCFHVYSPLTGIPAVTNAFFPTLSIKRKDSRINSNPAIFL